MDDKKKVLAVLASAGTAGLTQTELSTRAFGRHRTQAQLREYLGALAEDGLVESCLERVNGSDRPVLRWREIANSHVRTEPTDELVDDSAVPPGEVRPPEGEGWVRWKDVLYIAQAGVPRGYALRQGKRLRSLKRQRNKTSRTIDLSLTDEQYGIRHIARESLRNAVERGFIERRGEWARLVRNPTMTQRPWMEAAFSILGKAHPTLSGEFTPKPPKTLASVKEAELGRRLLDIEFVKRERGFAGTWDPEHIEVRVRMPRTSSVAELEAFFADYRERIEQAPRVIEPRPFEVNLPKNRGVTS